MRGERRGRGSLSHHCLCITIVSWVGRTRGCVSHVVVVTSLLLHRHHVVRWRKQRGSSLCHCHCIAIMSWVGRTRGGVRLCHHCHVAVIVSPSCCEMGRTERVVVMSLSLHCCHVVGGKNEGGCELHRCCCVVVLLSCCRVVIVMLSSLGHHHVVRWGERRGRGRGSLLLLHHCHCIAVVALPLSHHHHCVAIIAIVS